MNENEVLYKYFNYEKFRYNQEAVVKSLINNENTIAIIPTGGGKSVCFQVPALMKDGLCIVVTPLVSLMIDQVNQLKKLKIKAEAIYHSLNKSVIDETYKNISDLKFLYVSPERLNNDSFLFYLKEIKINYLIIDEAHCISSWGVTFRKSYLEIKKFIDNYKNLVIGIFSATLRKKDIDFIIDNLKLNNYQVFNLKNTRENLTFIKINTYHKFALLKQLINKEDAIIIYCSRIKTVNELFNLLNKDYSVSIDHGKLSFNEKIINQKAFFNNKNNIMICTNSFGMGVNKKNIRKVIHYEVSSSIEDYYQEAGRAGRDFLEAKCILLFNKNDFKRDTYNLSILRKNNKESYLKQVKNYKKVYQYLKTRKCLDVVIARYFNIIKTPCKKCSNCHEHKLLNSLLFLKQKILIIFNKIIKNN